MTEVWIVNGHLPTCAYMRSLDDLTDYEPCDCAGWDDDGDEFDDYYADGDEGGW